MIELSQYDEAIFYLRNSLKIDQKNILTIKILTELFSSFELSKLNKKEKDNVKDLFIFIKKIQLIIINF